MLSILTPQFCGNLSIVGAPPEYKPHPQLFFSGEWGGNFELEFCKTTEDKFNGFMSCISHSVILHETTNIIDV